MTAPQPTIIERECERLRVYALRARLQRLGLWVYERSAKDEATR